MRDLKPFPDRKNRWFPWGPQIGHKFGLVDRRRDERVTGIWQFGQLPTETYTGIDATFTTDDFGKVHVFDNGSDYHEAYLPSVDTTHIGSWLTCVRLDDGLFRIFAADSDVIANSSAGGTIECADTTVRVDWLTLYLMTETQWSIGGFGIWSVR